MESSEDYIKRLIGYVGTADPLEILRTAPATLREMVRGLPAELQTKPSAPGKWSIVQIAAHLAEDELVLGYRFRTVLASSGAVIAGFDQDRWAAIMHYETIPLEASLIRYEVMRAWNVDVLLSLTDEEWEQYGVHSERGRESIRDMARLGAGHDINHLNQIRGIIGS